MGKCRTAVNRILMMRGRNLSGPMFQNIGGGMCAHTAGNFIGSGDTEPSILFHAATFDPDTYECLLQAVGVGTPTSIHTADLYAPDYLGIYREFGEDEPVRSGGRVVENLLTYSEDFSNSDWTKAGTLNPVDLGNGEWRLDNFADANGDRVGQTTGSGTMGGKTLSTAIYVKGEGSDIGKDVRITLKRSGGGSFISSTIDVTLTDVFVRYSLDLTLYADNPDVALWYVKAGQGNDAEAPIVKHPQLEDITAEVNILTRQNPELVTDGSFDTACGVNWTCGTGWSIGSGVASCDGTQTTDSSVQESYLLEPDTTYLVEYDLVSVTAGTIYPLLMGLGSGTLRGVAGHYSEVITASGGDALKALYMVARSTFIGSIDNVSVKELVEVAPGEYVPTTTAPAQKVFANENGNTVLDNVVTEAVGVPLPEQPYLVSQPAATNLITDSRDLTGWTAVGTPVVSYDRVGITGEANTATYLGDDDDTSETIYEGVIVADSSNAITVSVRIRKDNDETRYPGIRYRLTGGAEVSAYWQINTKTGDTILVVGSGTEIRVVDEGDWWKVLIQGYNDSSGNDLLRTYLYGAYGLVWGSSSSSAIGSIIVGNVEVYDNKTIEEVRGLGPIFTEGTAVSTDAVNPTYDAGNHDNLEGGYYTEIRYVGDDTDVLTVDGNLLRIDVPKEIIDNGNFSGVPDNTPIGDVYRWNLYGTPTQAEVIDNAFVCVANAGSQGGTLSFDTQPAGKYKFSFDITGDGCQVYYYARAVPPNLQITYPAGHHEEVVEFTGDVSSVLFRGPNNQAGSFTVTNISMTDDKGTTLQLTDGTNTNLAELPITVGEHKVGCAYGVEYGPELVTNSGNPFYNTDDWVPGYDATLSIEGGSLRINRGPLLNANCAMGISTEIGKTYYCTINFTGESDASDEYLDFRIGLAVGGVENGRINPLNAGDEGHHSVVFTATAATTYVSAFLRNGADGNWVQLGEVSVQEITGTMDLNLNGVWAGEVTYDGSFGTGAIIQGETAREIQRIDITSYDKSKIWVDGEMT